CRGVVGCRVRRQAVQMRLERIRLAEPRASAHCGRRSGRTRQRARQRASRPTEISCDPGRCTPGEVQVGGSAPRPCRVDRRFARRFERRVTQHYFGGGPGRRPALQRSALLRAFRALRPVRRVPATGALALKPQLVLRAELCRCLLSDGGRSRGYAFAHPPSFSYLERLSSHHSFHLTTSSSVTRSGTVEGGSGTSLASARIARWL